MFPVTSCDQLPVDRTIIKGCEYDAAIEAKNIIAEAHAFAESTRQRAEAEYQRQQQLGYADGMKKAEAEAAERMTATVAKTAAYFSNVENRVVEVVGKALRKIIGEMDEHDLLAHAVRHALAWARGQSQVVLRVCPDQAAPLRLRVEEIRRGYPLIDVIDVVADDRLAPLDCMLETEIGSVNASIDVQVAAIEAALAKTASNDANIPETTLVVPKEHANQPDPEAAVETNS